MLALPSQKHEKTNHKNLSLKEAADEVIHHRLPKLKGDGGLIAIDAMGNIAMPFNTEGMYRGKKTTDKDSYVAIYSN